MSSIVSCLFIASLSITHMRADRMEENERESGVGGGKAELCIAHNQCTTVPSRKA